MIEFSLAWNSHTRFYPTTLVISTLHSPKKIFELISTNSSKFKKKYLSIYLSTIHISIHLSNYLYTYLSIYIHIFIHLYIYPSIYLYLYISIHLFINLSLYLENCLWKYIQIVIRKSNSMQIGLVASYKKIILISFQVAKMFLYQNKHWYLRIGNGLYDLVLSINQ